MIANTSILDKLIQTAMKSSIAHQHAAVLIMPGMKPISFSENFIQGKKNFHSEFAAIDLFMKNNGVFDKCNHRQWLLQKYERLLYKRKN